MEADVKEILQELVALLKGGKPQGSAASVAGPPQQAVVLMLQDPLTGEMRPVQTDPEGLGIRVTPGPIAGIPHGGLVLTSAYTLEVILSAVKTTNDMPVTGSYEERSPNGVTYGAIFTATNGNTGVSALAAPSSPNTRHVKSLRVVNEDTAAKTLTVRLYNGTTRYALLTVTLAVGDVLLFDDWAGWRVLDADGKLKSTGGSGGSSVNYIQAGPLMLVDTTKKLQIKLGAGVASNQCPVVVVYEDQTTSGVTPGAKDAVTNNTTAVDICDAPASSTYRRIKSITIYNADVGSLEVIVLYNNNGTTRVIYDATVLSFQRLNWSEEFGWEFDS